MDIADEDIDATIEKMKLKHAEVIGSESSYGGSVHYLDVYAHTETHVKNEVNEYEGSDSYEGTQMAGTTEITKKQVFQCTECDDVFQMRDDLMKHIDTHFDIETFSTDIVRNKKKRDKNNNRGKSKKNVRCKLCSYKCTNKGRLKDHMTIHSDEKPFSCDQCDFRTKHKLSLKLHTENKHGINKLLHEQLFNCIGHGCNFETKSVTEITEHIDTHDEIQKSVMCPNCEFTGYTKEHMKAHMRSHKNEKIFKCTYPDCDYRVARKGSFQTHLKIHTGEKPHQCPHCEHRCVSKTKLRYHITIHSDKKPYHCDLCDYKCALKDGLNKHKRSHTKPFKCLQCSFRCAEKPYLNQHMLKHTGEKPFACHRCDFRAVSKILLNSHLLVHSTEKPYACDYCSYATNRKQELTRHVERRHSTDKPHRCECCPYATSQKRELNRHIERMHNELRPAQRRPQAPRQPRGGGPRQPRAAPRPPKIQPNEAPPEAVLPQQSSFGPGSFGMTMPPAMGQMGHMPFGGYQFPHNAHGIFYG